jgi:hypothetical protein
MPISPSGLEIPLPDPSAVVAKQSLSGLGANQYFKRPIHNFTLGFQSSQLAGFSDQCFINIDVSACHGRQDTPFFLFYVYAEAPSKRRVQPWLQESNELNQIGRKQYETDVKFDRKRQFSWAGLEVRNEDMAPAVSG